MSARLTTAIKISKSAEAILQTTRISGRKNINALKDWDENAHIGVQPMLLALSMELALKAWFVFDYDKSDVVKSHNLSKLFDGLKAESREKLDIEFRRSVAPNHPSGLHIDYSIKHVLFQHANAFVDWRYLHEPKNASFETSVFVATLEMVLREFKKRYREDEVLPIHPSL